MESNITLWQFLLELLVDEQQYKSIITWTNNEGEFKLINDEEVAKLWGLRKNKHNMNYDKLSRALRYYYDKHIIKKVQGQKFVYRFVTNPALSFSSPHPHSQHHHHRHPSALGAPHSGMQTPSFGPTKAASLPQTPSSPLMNSQQTDCQLTSSAASHHHHLSALYQNHHSFSMTQAANNLGQNPFGQSHHNPFVPNHHHHGNPFSAHHHQLASYHLHSQASTGVSENEPTDLSRKTGSCSSVASSSSASASPTSTSPPTSPCSCDVNNNSIISDIINNHHLGSATPITSASSQQADVDLQQINTRSSPQTIPSSPSNQQPVNRLICASPSASPSSSPVSMQANSGTADEGNCNNDDSSSTTKSNSSPTSNTATGNTVTTDSTSSSSPSSQMRAHKNKPKPPPISTSLAAAAAQQHSHQHLNSTSINKTLQTPNIQFASPFPRFNSSLNLNSPVHNSPMTTATQAHSSSRHPSSSSNNVGGSNGSTEEPCGNGNVTNNTNSTLGGGQQHHNQQQHHTPTTPSTPSTAHSLLSNPSLSLWSQFTNPLLSPLIMNHKHQQQSSLNGTSNNNSNAALTKGGMANKDSNNNTIKSEINNNTSPFNQSPHAFQFPAPAMAAAAAMSGATGQPLDKCMSTILGSPLLSPLLFGDQSLFSPLKLENPLHL